ncbi:MAG: dephospho-CoA kinase [Peptococcaceae bacterium]|jgi:dephospho-CoA kinase|nr:dephospho-CoA kinase [Peptococcaceae bacterium]
MYIIGLTGGIGSGKTSVAQWFRGKDIPVLDADAAVHQILDQDPLAARRLAEEFGARIIRDSKIDRMALGKIVFANDAARERLESIIHPLVWTKMSEEEDALRRMGRKLCIWDIPLLIEAGKHRQANEVWVVWASARVQIQRVQQRSGLSEQDIRSRIQAQMPLDLKRDLADVVIDNAQDWQTTLVQLEEQWHRLERMILRAES